MAAQVASGQSENDDDPRAVIALESNYVAAADTREISGGEGFALRLGVQDSTLLGLLAARGEVGFSYADLGDPMGRVFLGGRAGLQVIVVGLYAYGHLGYGWSRPSNDFTFDLGLSVDLIVFDVLRPGLHVEYANIVDGLQMFVLGAHLDFMP